MKNERLKYLLERHLSGSLLQCELEEMYVLLEEIPDTDFVIIWEELQHDQRSRHQLSSEKRSLLKYKIQQQLRQRSEPSRTSLVHTAWIRRAAAILLLGAASLLLYRYYKSSPVHPDQSVRYASADIFLSADSLPKLVFAKGQEIEIKAANRKLLKNKGMVLQEDKDGMLHVLPAAEAQPEQVHFRTPKGYTSKIKLVDGTMVWLNSNSKLTFPSVFAPLSREVQLEGEAYFEVAKQENTPFFVQTDKGKVAVLGTHFDVKAYKGDNVQSVTLLEGAVKVTNRVSSLLLKPGQQASIQGVKETIQKSEVDVASEVSWLKGYYTFNNQNIKEMMTMLSNWYDIEGVDVKTNALIEFSGTIKRSKSLNDVLRNLSKIAPIKFQIHGRRVVVMDK